MMAQPTPPTTGVHQRADEDLPTFIDRVDKSLQRKFPPGPLRDQFIKMLVWDEMNADHKLAGAGQKDHSMSRWVVSSKDIATQSHQSKAIAVALQAQTEALTEAMSKAFSARATPRQGGGLPSGNKSLRMGLYFGCGQEGHFKYDCPASRKRPSFRPPLTTPSPQCKKRYHWKNDCRSKMDKEGRSLNEVRGNPQPRYPKGGTLGPPRLRLPKLIGPSPLCLA